MKKLGSAIGAGLLKFCARCWWVEATSEWRLVKHPADSRSVINQSINQSIYLANCATTT